MSPAHARLVLTSDPSKVAPLAPDQPLTIGRAAGNRLCLSSATGVSEHHAVVRFSAGKGWLVCDWQSRDGTFLQGQRVQQCRVLSDGDAIQLGQAGPVLRFELTANAAVPPPSTPSAGRAAPVGNSTAAERAPHPGVAAPASGGQRPTSRGTRGAPASSPAAAAPGGTLDFAGERLALTAIRSATVLSQPQHPHIFSWWLLLCLGGLLLLPFPLVFWPLQLLALTGWILLGSRKQHQLLVVLHDGRALRHGFANQRTALAHRNGIRRAIGQSLETR
jgi:hypothetical protein